MKKNVRQSKYDPMVEEVELLECNPQYASIRYKDGRESTVSVKQLAPAGRDDEDLQMQLPTNKAHLKVPSNRTHQTLMKLLPTHQTDMKLSLN